MNDIRVCDAREYDMPCGFVVEQKRYWGGLSEETWAIPDWEEMGMADLCGPFKTRAEAQRAIDSYC